MGTFQKKLEKPAKQHLQCREGTDPKTRLLGLSCTEIGESPGSHHCSYSQLGDGCSADAWGLALCFRGSHLLDFAVLWPVLTDLFKESTRRSSSVASIQWFSTWLFSFWVHRGGWWGLFNPFPCEDQTPVTFSAASSALSEYLVNDQELVLTFLFVLWVLEEQMFQGVVLSFLSHLVLDFTAAFGCSFQSSEEASSVA